MRRYHGYARGILGVAVNRFICDNGDVTWFLFVQRLFHALFTVTNLFELNRFLNFAVQMVYEKTSVQPSLTSTSEARLMANAEFRFQEERIRASTDKRVI